MLARVQIEHELGERTMQPREPARQHREPRTGDPPGGFEIEPTEDFAERHVIARFEVKALRAPPNAALRHSPTHRCPSGTLACSRLGNPSRICSSCACTSAEPQLDGLQLAAQRIGACQERGDVLPCSLRLADRLGLRVALVAQAVGFDLQLLALLLQGGECREVEREPATREVRGDDFRFVAEQPRIDHVVFFLLSLAEALR